MGINFAYNLIVSDEGLSEACQDIASGATMGLDIETTSLKPRDGQIRLIQVCSNSRQKYVFDLFRLGPDNTKKVIQALRDFKGIVIIQNAKFEVKWFWHHYNLELWPIFDTYRASALIHNGIMTEKHHLYALWWRLLQYTPQSPDLGASNWAGTLTKDQYDYAAEDIIHLHQMRDILKAQLTEYGLNKIALIEFGAVQAEAEIELAGFRLDADKWTKLAKNNQKDMEKLRTQLIAELPPPTDQISLFSGDTGINLDSNQQVLVSLRKLGLEQRVQIPDSRAFKWVPIQDTNEMTLTNIRKPHPLVDKLLAYREKATQLKTFGLDFLDNIDKHTGRIHTDYFPFTGAGRYSSSKPNLQNQPRLEQFRECWTPGPGKRLVICDYAGIEMRVGGEIANDYELIKIFKEGLDVHKATASFLNGKPYKDITKADKQQAKALNFGLLFGMGSQKLVLYAKSNYGVVLTEKEAEAKRNKFFQKYYGLAKWHRSAIANFQAVGVTRTIGGRLRHLPPTAYSDVLNSPVQGTAADGLKAALRLVVLALRKFGVAARVVHHVHDEIIVEVDDIPELVKEVEAVVEGCMIKAMSQFLIHIPVKAEPSNGLTWADK